jgi:hypothetical protein
VLLRIARRYQEHLGQLDPAVTWVVPTGSGETVLALRLVYPGIKFVARYDNALHCTRYEPDNPLNAAVAALVEVEVAGE